MMTPHIADEDEQNTLITEDPKSLEESDTTEPEQPEMAETVTPQEMDQSLSVPLHSTLMLQTCQRMEVLGEPL